MLQFTRAFSGFSANDLDAEEAFYTKLLGDAVSRNEMRMIELDLAGTNVIIYPKSDHQPAAFTVLNLEVDDIDVAVSELTNMGIVLEHYDGLTDDSGVARGLTVGRGPNIAWFKDPCGNIVSVLCGK